MAVTDEAILKIRAMIVSGHLAPGERLPPEKELSEHLGISRNSLREAVKALEVIKVIDVRRGDGTHVTSLEPHLLLEAMSFVIDLHQDQSIVQIFEVRGVLEPYAAWRAAKVITDEQIAILRDMVNSVKDTASIEDLVMHDIQFHGLITEACGNAYLTSLLEGLSSSTIRARVWRGITEEGAVTRTLQEHRAIVEALACHDPELTRSWVAIHVGGIESWLRNAS